jgi:hypothetical protein
MNRRHLLMGATQSAAVTAVSAVAAAEQKAKQADASNSINI